MQTTGKLIILPNCNHNFVRTIDKTNNSYNFWEK